MRRVRKGFIMIAGFILILSYSCIDPFSLEIKEKSGFLVVDGLITNEERPYIVKISRTHSEQQGSGTVVSGATVTISSSAGETVTLNEIFPGTYSTVGNSFRGEIGRSYSLSIVTTEGLEYVSDPSVMMDVPEIDSISYIKDTEFLNNGKTAAEGIRILVNYSVPDNGQTYNRWEFDECWKFSVPYPVRFSYTPVEIIQPVPMENYYCWKYNSSRDVVLQSATGRPGNTSMETAVTFIGSALSDRLSVRYSINVKQYSLNRKEYEFWSNIRQVMNAGGDIFDKQPYTVTGNVYNKSEKSEPVMGYFQVSAVKEKRRFISGREIYNLFLPMSYPDCELVIIGRGDFEPPRPTLDQIHEIYTRNGWLFVNYDMDENENIILYFARPVCANCSLTGNPVRPVFWED